MAAEVTVYKIRIKRLSRWPWDRVSYVDSSVFKTLEEARESARWWAEHDDYDEVEIFPQTFNRKDREAAADAKIKVVEK